VNKSSRWLRAWTCFSLAGLFAYVFYIRYWQWRECIEAALSSCLTPDGDNLTQGGMMWAVPALGFLLVGLRLVLARGDS
jgi:hypothetical protein